VKEVPDDGHCSVPLCGADVYNTAVLPGIYSEGCICSYRLYAGI